MSIILKADINGTKIRMKRVKNGFKVSQAGFYREFTCNIEAAKWFAQCVKSVADQLTREIEDVETARKNLKKELSGE